MHHQDTQFATTCLKKMRIQDRNFRPRRYGLTNSNVQPSCSFLELTVQYAVEHQPREKDRYDLCYETSPKQQSGTPLETAYQPREKGRYDLCYNTSPKQQPGTPRKSKQHVVPGYS